jgi:hypothetical protein
MSLFNVKRIRESASDDNVAGAKELEHQALSL